MLENACDELNGRLPIFVCPMCGDFGCGVGTVEVIKEDQHIVWQNFRWERDYDEWSQQSDNQKHFKRTFDAEQYMKVFDLYRSTL